MVKYTLRLRGGRWHPIEYIIETEEFPDLLKAIDLLPELIKTAKEIEGYKLVKRVS